MVVSYALYIDGGNFAISAWVLARASAGRYGIYSARNTTSNNYQLELGTCNGASGANRVCLTSTGSFNAETSSGAYTTNTWNHIVYTKSNLTGAGFQKIYVNGVNQTLISDTNAVKSDYNISRTFGYLGSHGTYSPIQLDEVRIYNRSLSATEVADLYNLGSTHITDWTSWSPENLVEDNVGINTSTAGKFFQFKTDLKSNTTDVSPYIISYNTNGFIDSVPPTVIITYPQALNYSSVLSLNYSVTDDYYANKCWYSTNGGVTNSSSVNAGTNFTVTGTEGSNTWIVYCNDSFNNIGSNSVTFMVDTLYPSINFTSPTYASGLYEGTTNILSNISVSDSGTGIKNYTTYLYNLTSLINTSSSLYNNFVGLPFTTYYLNATTCDYVNLCNSTETRIIILTSDANKPLIQFKVPTDTSYSVHRNITMNVTGSDLNWANMTLYVYDNAGNIVRNLTTTSTSYYWQVDSFLDGTYMIQANATDTYGNVNATEIRYVVVDNTAPYLTIIAPLNNYLYGYNPVELNVSVSDTNGVDKVWYYLDNILQGFFTPNRTTFNLATTGTYNISACANDTVDNYVCTAGVLFNYVNATSGTGGTGISNTTRFCKVSNFGYNYLNNDKYKVC